MRIHDPEQLVRTLTSLPAETEWVEFKESMFDPEEVGQYVSALSNSAMLADERHGYMIWGVKDGSHEIVGTTARPASKNVKGQPFEHWVAQFLDPRVTLEFASVEIDEKRVEILCIDPAYTKPVRFKGDAWVRVNFIKRRLPDFTDRERALWQITSRQSFEEAVCTPHLSENQVLKRFDVERLIQIMDVKSFAINDAITRLCDLRLLIDNTQGGYDATNLLALSAARDMKAYPATSGKSVRVVTYRGTDRLHALHDITGQHGYLVRFEEIVAYIQKETAEGEEFSGGMRKMIQPYPEVAVREVLANALIHQDFMVHGSKPLVEIYADKIRFVNPGRPRIPTSRFIGAAPLSRNERLADLARRTPVCEARGSGMPRAMVAIEQARLAPMLIETEEHATVVTLYKTRNYASMSREERTRACYQHACLRYHQDDPMSNASLRERLGLTKNQHPQASQVIAAAIEDKLIKALNADQGNRVARYVPYWVGEADS